MKDSLLVKSRLAVVLTKERIDYSEITYIFSNDGYVLRLNQEYLKHDYFTDILTFTLSLPNSPVHSEIYISIDRVKENAAELGIPFENELFRVMIHGLLHLAGYDDHSAKEKSQMRAREDFYLKDMF